METWREDYPYDELMDRRDDYTAAMEAMLTRTDKNYAPWMTVKGND